MDSDVDTIAPPLNVGNFEGRTWGRNPVGRRPTQF